MMTHSIIGVYVQIRTYSLNLLPRNCLHKQRMGLSHLVANVLRKPVLTGPLKSDIGKVQDMSEIVNEHMVYLYPNLIKRRSIDA